MTLLFIFDMDDVLYAYDWQARMRGMAQLTGLEPDELRDRWWNYCERAAEAGAYATAGEYLQAQESALGVVLDEAEWMRVRRSAMTPWPDSIAAVRRASQLGKVTLLTNNGPLVGKHLAAIAPEIAPLFGEHLLTSSHYGARKPDPKVFERVLAAYGAAGKNAFFVDDRSENVAAAASVGITAHLFVTPSAMMEAIESFAAGQVS